MEHVVSRNFIPLLLLEEHHEAFLGWSYAVKKQWISSEKNLLLHVDEHEDLQIPALDMAIPNPAGDLEELIRFTYTQLSVASFLYPAVYAGLFHKIYWLRQRHDPDAEPEIRCIGSEGGEGRRLRTSSFLNLSEALTPDRRCFEVIPITAQEPMEAPQQNVILDIDLDYFSCDNRAGEDWEMEITKSAYEEFRDNRYHPLRLASGNLVRVRHANGSYYLYSNYSHFADTDLKVDTETIDTRIDAFLEFLRRNSLRPALIDIARSRHSGYTPQDQWKLIEKKLLNGLSGLYNYSVITPDSFRS